MIFPLTTYLLVNREFEYVICGGLLATVPDTVSLAEHGSNNRGPPLEICQSVWRYARRNVMDSTGIMSVVSTCATVTATDCDAYNTK